MCEKKTKEKKDKNKKKSKVNLIEKFKNLRTKNRAMCKKEEKKEKNKVKKKQKKGTKKAVSIPAVKEADIPINSETGIQTI